MTNAETRPVALTIAGSDSSGGAGVQADLRVFAALGAFGASALTALTAQNLAGVDAVHGVPPDFVEAQVRAVARELPVAAVKTGMLWSAATVERVAALARELGVGRLVVDPVMVATSGARLLEPDAVRAYREALLPLATVATPNLDEAAVLLGVARIERAEMEHTAERLARDLGCAVLLKGGHLAGDPVDVLATTEERIHVYEHARREGTSTHGSGCMLSAAIAAELAHGRSLADAVERAIGFVDRALARPIDVGPHRLAGIERAGAR